MRLRWFNRFLEGKETMDNAPRSGGPSTSVKTDNIERVRQVLLQNRRLSIRWISKKLGNSKDSVSTIIHKYLDCIKMIFKRHCDTRWSSRRQAVAALQKNLPSVHKVLQRMTDRPNNWTTDTASDDDPSQRD
ncbi:hypothetical protein AVEN_187884-1 [Araneus ventricosus]|uniref:Mos1 transposase HTH domain-containing protein n=1 Tax=Araneus ventricosus TaxID=182803 RepID=A0A4Y2CSK3_ARAVE|nr:hypothetical protein AVEN_187884-1 [Araneus ventricosus]